MSKRLSISILALSLSVCLCPPCAIADQHDQKDMANVLATLDRANPAEYQAVMERFIAAAKVQDLQAMLALTSPKTRKEQGDDQLLDMYKSQYVVLFNRFPKMSAGGDVDNVHDASGNEGWVFKKVFSAEDGRQAKVAIVTLREQGTIYVSAIDLWK